MKDLTKLKPTDICIRATEETFDEIIELLVKLGELNDDDFRPRYKRSTVIDLYIEDREILYNVKEIPKTKVTLSELRQMAGEEKAGKIKSITIGGEVKTSKDMVIEIITYETIQRELTTLRKERDELKEMYKQCFELFIPTDKWDEATDFLSSYGNGILLKSKQLI